MTAGIGVLKLDSIDQVVFVLEVMLALGPLAVYFLALGLVNSQARPCLVRARADFALLAIAFVPVIIVPVAALVEHGWLWPAAGVVVGVTALFFGMLPGRGAGWVIYNVDPSQCRRLLQRACRRLGWTAEDRGGQLHVAQADLIVSLSAVPWLRNATVRVRSVTGVPCGSAGERLIRALGQEIRQETMLPSSTGASLVVIGAMLLGIPMWYLLHHMGAIVEVVRQILFT